ncbi:VOC family protein [Flexivirga endophytica]|nr:VOC family protein [Flexivirga endophytica]
MPEEVSSEEFHAADGVGDWRITGDGARARFRTGSFATGVQLVAEIGRLADAADHHPDVDLRYGHVGVRTWTHELPGITGRDVALAREISAAARELGVEADPGSVSSMQLTIDAVSQPAVKRFWQVVLGYDEFGDEDLIDPFGNGPWVHFQQMDEPRSQRNRVHVDLFLPEDEAAARVAAAVEAGGRIVYDAKAPLFWTLADPEGNEVDIAPWPDAH